jgi:hypothetical protein
MCSLCGASLKTKSLCTNGTQVDAQQHDPIMSLVLPRADMGC